MKKLSLVLLIAIAIGSSVSTNCGKKTDSKIESNHRKKCCLLVCLGKKKKKASDPAVKNEKMETDSSEEEISSETEEIRKIVKETRKNIEFIHSMNECGFGYF